MDPRRVTPEEEHAIRELHTAQAEARARELSNPTITDVAQSLGVPPEQVDAYLQEIRSALPPAPKTPRAASAVPWTLALGACIFVLTMGALLFRAVRVERADARTAPEVIVIPPSSSSTWDTRVAPSPEAIPASPIQPEPFEPLGHPEPIESEPPASHPPKPLEAPKVEAVPDPKDDGSGYPEAQYERAPVAPSPQSDASQTDAPAPETQPLP